MTRRLAIFAALIVTACSGGQGAEDISRNNRGVALMGSFDYAAAREVFLEVVESRPDWDDAKINLAIATLNMQGDDDVAEARRLAAEVVKDAPNNLRAHYVSGLLALYVGEAEAAVASFERVLRGDPDDAYAAYYLGQALLQLGRTDEAVASYRRARKKDGYLRSAYYGEAQALRRSGDAAAATELLNDYQRFENNPRARLAEFKYTRMGPKANALASGTPGGKTPRKPIASLFGTNLSLGDLVGDAAVRSITTVDADGDGVADHVDIWTETGTQNIQLDGPSALPAIAEANVRAPLWGDVDNNGVADLYLCRIGENRLYLNGEPFDTPELRDAGACADAAMFDADHDGDLDIFIANADGPNELINNDGDGTFRRLAADYGLTGHDESRAVVVNDLDGDRDADIIVINKKPPHDVYLNDRLWAYSRSADFAAFEAADIVAAAPADIDADGQIEIVTASKRGGILIWQPRTNGRWMAEPTAVNARVSENERLRLTVGDFDGDLRTDLLVDDAGGFQVATADTRFGLARSYSYSGPGDYFVPVLRDPVRGPSLVGVVTVDGRRQVHEWPPGSGRFEFASLAFSGREEIANSMRSNMSGIGARVAARLGADWYLGDTYPAGGVPGQGIGALSVGLAGRETIDFIAIDWSDGVFQTELDLGRGHHSIVETQRQLSSCPVVFAWDGERFRFVTDTLGVAGVGFMVAPGQYATPRPTEKLRLDDAQLAARDGELVFKVTEPMEEVAYLDRATLTTYDLPPGWHMLLDERMGTAPPAPTGEPVFFRNDVVPVSAHDGDGNDVLEAVNQRDGVAAPAGSVDPRFLGRLEKPQVLTLEFPETLGGRNAWLLADGWVEYPYSQTVFAAWQADRFYSPPTLEAQDANGDWQLVADKFGYPAGMPREMALPLTELPAGTKRLRLTTTLEIYWDRLRVVFAEPLTEPRTQPLALVNARVAKTGFPKRLTFPQKRPGYDYSMRKSFWDTRYPRGLYTAFGPVTPLVAQRDDGFAMIGPGEEVELGFEAPGELAPGWSRHYVLQLDGYAKDMDLYTRDSGSVWPLPKTAGLDAATRASGEQLGEKYNTRYLAGR